MSRLPDLVIDSKLETRINQEYTVHVYSDVDPALRSLTVEREERWQQKRSIGRGRFGDVFLEKCVQGIRQGELRAVKRIPRPKKELEYVRELEAIAKFSHSKYVHYFVKSYGWFHAAYDICIAMEYLPLGDLNKYLMESSSPLPEAETGQIVYQILSGISLMHENGYVHRDLKPSNILICSTPPEGWWVKIADFGISKRAENVTLTASTTKGTPGYMAPELQGFLSSKNSSKPSCSVDMWSLGEITFRMLTKKTVFDSPYDLFLYATTQQPLPTAPLVRAKVSEDSIHFIEHCMMVDPDLRFSAQQGLQCSWIMPLIPSSSEASLPDLTR
ncbi:kinase-like protein [Lojkania enalia]|uniref:mitogen-activated protein kinase kinase n=1 Tax=Lojkania enalia TaxID=147567 RepID=A0A9P4NA01_9PLEO|nr:kinase-like protein [Didymosphaeria enalia]